MLKIAHRGNTDGPNPDYENSPKYLVDAINLLYDVEVDLWRVNNVLYLGHDEPQYIIPNNWFYVISYHSFMICDRAWIHCKNPEALDWCSRQRGHLNYFWHNTDDYTITSKGFIWAYPGKASVHDNTIMVLPENCFDKSFFGTEYDSFLKGGFFGVCSDYVGRIK